MKLLQSVIVWSVLLTVLYATWQVVAAEGWRAGGVFLLLAIFIVGVFIAIYDFLFSLFRCRREH